jgi:hypothetical protein
MPRSQAPRFDAEVVACAAVLGAVLLIGLVTAPDYGITIDEFYFQDYGPLALAWYASGFTDRAVFGFQDTEWYGPWAQMLIAAVQSLGLANWLTVRHAMTFAIGLAGLAALLPLARLTVGRWAGLIAILLCLLTGYLYGLLFFAPVDTPFLAAMTWATLAIVAMTRRELPSWRTTLITGLLIGLAIGIRTGGVIAIAYLFGALALCALEIAVRRGRSALPALTQIALRFLAAIAVAGVTTYAVWPWLQIGNPLAQFKDAYLHFAEIKLPMQFPSWGRELSTGALPWHYIPEQLLARLPELFIVLLLVALVAGLLKLVALVRNIVARYGRDGIRGLAAPALWLARSRGFLVVVVAALAPGAIIAVQHMTVYDGIRHVLFIIPMLALLAAWGCMQLMPIVRHIPKTAAVLGALQVIVSVTRMVTLHPLEYAATNAFAGGLEGSYGRFELDFWSAAGSEAVRRLERRLNADPLLRPAGPPRVINCTPWREHAMGKIYPKDWIVSTDPAQADFLIETERYRCAQGRGAKLIDEVTRGGRAFAWTYAAKPTPAK